MRIELCGLVVKDQADALRFYTEVLGFVKKVDLPAGEYRWLTVVSPEQPDGAQVSLEPNANPIAANFQDALHEQGVPATSFAVDDVAAEYERLKGLGVEFSTEPTDVGSAIIAVFDDTCGNYIQMHQETGG